MVISFSAALRSSAQTESQSELPSRRPSFHRCLFLFLSKKEGLFGQIFTSGASYQFSELDSLLLANITPLGLGHRHPGQALTIPGWRTSGNLYLFPTQTLRTVSPLHFCASSGRRILTNVTSIPRDILGFWLGVSLVTVP